MNSALPSLREYRRSTQPGVGRGAPRMPSSCSASSSRVKGGQLDQARARVARQLGQQRPQRMAAVQLVRAVGGDHQQRARGTACARERARNGASSCRPSGGPRSRAAAGVLLATAPRAAPAEPRTRRLRGRLAVLGGPQPSPGRIASRPARGAAAAPRAPGRRRARAGAARRGAARRAARPRRARRSRPRARARRSRARRAQLARPAATCRRPTHRPPAPARDGPRPRRASAASSSASSAERPTKRALVMRWPSGCILPLAVCGHRAMRGVDGLA